MTFQLFFDFWLSDNFFIYLSTFTQANLTDEEVHAIAATLRNNESIIELNLRGNTITDEGCRAIASILSGLSALKYIDLRGNQISRNGVKSMAEALERSDRVKHVYVHAGGKIEALGANHSTSNFWHQQSEKAEMGCQETPAPLVSVETICIVDIRENSQGSERFGINQDMIGLKKVTQERVAHNPFNVGSLSVPIKPHIEESNQKKQSGKGWKKHPIQKNKVESSKGSVTREKGWRGRAGGIDVVSNRSHSQSPSHRKQWQMDSVGGALPPVRPNSAGAVKKDHPKTKHEGMQQDKPQISPFLQQLSVQNR